MLHIQWYTSKTSTVLMMLSLVFLMCRLSVSDLPTAAVIRYEPLKLLRDVFVSAH